MLKSLLPSPPTPRVIGPSSTFTPPQPSSAAAVVTGSPTANPEPPSQGWECGARLSSDDNEEDDGRGPVESPEADPDRPSCPYYSARHPRPLAVGGGAPLVGLPHLGPRNETQI